MSRSLFPWSIVPLVVGVGVALGLVERNFFWIGSYVLLVFPLFQDNVCRCFELKLEAIRHNFLRRFSWARLISLGICILRASTLFPGRWIEVHIYCGSDLWGFRALGRPVRALLHMVDLHCVWWNWLVVLARVPLPLLPL